MSGTPAVLLPDDLIGLLRRPSPCFISTVMPDGSPQMTQTWVDTDGHHILINTVVGYRKAKNIARDPRVAISVTDPDDVSRYYALRGHVIDSTTDGAAENVEELSHKYLGTPHPNFSGKPETRLLLTIAVDSIAHAPRT
ncbi:TIGR03618 family F420-dependent PPOX class oxidoreductase [Amycolatopsis mongoliensis]|uniref:TIGR03618 family F420-dependent PPOX class oxidoreductase n=1 Tax=Amycolatopsis mongoliensis TaxID=715475 RepID=A0A9Y2NHR4_9PSEU|nr:TIGR03618 family F420-dependent PPOX class oxidoreductase [Amycolatopsis sp. 4-36]WIX98454.1 TIGR03618 family F420-dependent PPOX class oxidoreductase [Amycolatopsis sp. 4-36]